MAGSIPAISTVSFAEAVRAHPRTPGHIFAEFGECNWLGLRCTSMLEYLIGASSRLGG